MQYANTSTSTRNQDNHFSDEIWSNTASHYQVSIKGLSEESKRFITEGAWRISQHRHMSSSTAAHQNGPEVNERELLTEGDNAVENDEERDWDACKS
jgi:hypothetical protein